MASFMMYATYSHVPYCTKLISSGPYLYMICFYVFRFWTVRRTVWTCSGYWASCAKPVIPQDWALLYQYERSMLLEDLFCAPPFETQQARCWNSFDTASILLSFVLFSLYLWNFPFLIEYGLSFVFIVCRTTTILKKHLLIDLDWEGNLHRS